MQLSRARIFGSLAYDTAMDILEEKEVQRDITVTPRMITGDKKIKEEDKNGRIFKTGTDMDKET